MVISTDLVNIPAWKTELVNYARYKLRSLDPKSRITETTTTFSGDDSTTAFTLTSPLRYVAFDSVTVDSIDMSYGTDWLPVTDPDDSNYGKIVFTSAPATGTDNISVTHGYGSKEWIYPDFPREDLAISQYPRIGMGIMESPLPGGLGGTQNVLKNRIRISIIFLAENTRLLDEMDHTLKSNIVADAKRFYHFRYIQPDASRMLTNSEDATGMVLALNRDFLVDNKFSITDYN